MNNENSENSIKQDKQNENQPIKEVTNNNSNKKQMEVPALKNETLENIDKLSNNDKKKLLEHLINDETIEVLTDKDNQPKDVVKATLESKVMGMFLSNRPSSVLQDMPDEAINKVVDIIGQDSERAFNLAKHNSDLNHQQFCITSRNNIIYSLLGAIIFIFLVIFFGKTKPEYIYTLFQLISVFLGGSGIALWYIKSNKDKTK